MIFRSCCCNPRTTFTSGSLETYINPLAKNSITAMCPLGRSTCACGRTRPVGGAWSCCGPSPGGRRPWPTGCCAGEPSPAAHRTLLAGGRWWLEGRGRAASTASWTRRTSADTPSLPLIRREKHLAGARASHVLRPPRPGAWRGRRRGTRRRGSRRGNRRRNPGVGEVHSGDTETSVRRRNRRATRGALSHDVHGTGVTRVLVFISFAQIRKCITP
jgi:hypothetical protein